ncbi:uncharacterized protein [Rutidosis leptorrhynchoides]|uniref:uncharacterized protein n=1 Tax=Rutidosis leptorrhynchoides TaxID=125765 RepID=UPI003A993A94
MVTADVDLELRQQLKEAGNQLSNPPEPVDELLHLLDQTEKLLGMVDQSPNKQMQEALNGPIKALVDDRLLKHSNMDVKVSVANCICEITRVTAPEAPYSDDEMKGYFQLVVSSFEDLWDESSRSYNKRLSILDIVYKVRSSLIMLDLECDALIVDMFKHFLKSVRDHHIDKGFSLMKNIMCLVIEESEEISDDLLNTLLASVKIDSEGVLPVARKLGEEVIETSAVILRPYLKQAVKRLNDYSHVLTSVCEGTSNPSKHNDENASLLNKTDETKLAPASDNSVQVISNGNVGTSNDEVSDKESKKPEEAIDLDHSNDKKTSPVIEKSTLTESKLVPTSNQTENESVEPSDSADRNDVEIEAVDHPLKNASPLKEPETINAGPVSHGMDTIKKGVRSKKKSSDQTAAEPLTNVVLTKAPEVLSDVEMKSPKRVRKKTLKAEDNNKPSVKIGSDAKLAEKVTEETSDAEMVSPKRARKKTPKVAETKKKPSEKVNQVDSESTQGKKSGKKVATSGSDDELLKKPSKKVDTVDLKSKAVESLTKEAGGTDLVSDMEVVKSPSKKVDGVDSGSKVVKSQGKGVGGKRSGSKKGKANDKKTEGGDSKSKKSKQGDKKVDTENKEEETENKVIVKPIEDTENKDEETDSEATIVKVPENVDEQTDSDDKLIKLSAKKVNENSSEVKSSLKKKPVVKSTSKKKVGKTVEEKMETKPVSDDDDGMDVPIKSALKTVNKGGKLKETQASSSKRKRSVAKKSKVNIPNSLTSSQVAECVKYDGSLIGKKVKVWWPDDEMYYEGVVASFDATEKKHKVSYLDGEEEILNLKDEKWEIIEEYSVQNEENAVEGEAQNTDVVLESPVKKKAKKTSGPSAKRLGGGKKGEGKVGNKSNSNETEKTKKDEQKSPTVLKTSPLVYKSKGRKNKSKEVDTEPKDDAKDGAKEPVSVVEKSTGPKTGSKSGQKRKKT